MKKIALLLLLFTLVFCSGCANNKDWGEEMVYIRLYNGSNSLDYGITEEGELMKLVANHGVEEFDFSDCKTGDVLRMDVYLIQEIFPANAVYLRCEPTGSTAAIDLNDSCQGWLDGTLQNADWMILP